MEEWTSQPEGCQHEYFFWAEPKISEVQQCLIPNEDDSQSSFWTKVSPKDCNREM